MHCTQNIQNQNRYEVNFQYIHYHGDSTETNSSAANYQMKNNQNRSYTEYMVMRWVLITESLLYWANDETILWILHPTRDFSPNALFMSCFLSLHASVPMSHFGHSRERRLRFCKGNGAEWFHLLGVKERIVKI